MTQIVVDVFEMARAGQSVAGAAPIEAMSRLAPLLASPSGTVDYTFRAFVDSRQRPAASLALRATLCLTCNHCDQPVSFALDARHDYTFVHDERALAAIAIDAGDDEPLLGDKRFDLAALIEDEIILSVPLAPRHAACQLAIDTETVARTQTEPASGGPFVALATLRGSAGTEPKPNKRRRTNGRLDAPG